MILSTEEVITEASNVISASTKVISATEEVISTTLKTISAATKVTLATEEDLGITATIKSYLSLYKSDLGHWRGGHSHFENYLSH